MGISTLLVYPFSLSLLVPFLSSLISWHHLILTLLICHSHCYIMVPLTTEPTCHVRRLYLLLPLLYWLWALMKETGINLSVKPFHQLICGRFANVFRLKSASMHNSYWRPLWRSALWPQISSPTCGQWTTPTLLESTCSGPRTSCTDLLLLMSWNPTLGLTSASMVTITCGPKCPTAKQQPFRFIRITSIMGSYPNTPILSLFGFRWLMWMRLMVVFMRFPAAISGN